MRVDYLLYNANILTLDHRQPRANSLAVLGNRILAVEQGNALRDHFLAEHELDLKGLTVVPGFNDAHNHMIFFGMSLAELPLSTPPMHSVGDICAAVAHEAEKTPAGSWIVGSRYDQNKLAEKRHPTAAELDRVAPDHLVWLKHTSGHMSVVNSRTLKAIDIDNVPVPAGGVVVRDSQNRPTGLLQEGAQKLVADLLYPYPVDMLVDALGRASDQFLREGVTSATEAGLGIDLIPWSPLELRAYQEARRAGKLHVRMNLMIGAEVLHELRHHESDGSALALDLGLHSGFGDEWLRIGPVKIFSDGSMIGRTAALFEDFANDPGNRGFLQYSEDQLRQLVLDSHRSGWQVATHAVGDRAVATVLDIYEEALNRYPRPDHRHRIEHCGVVNEELVVRMAKLGVIPVPQGHFISEIGDSLYEALGPERTRWSYPQRTFLDRGMVYPGSSDRPIVDGNPLLGIHDMVNQKTLAGRPFNPREALTPVQALRVYTYGSAYSSFEEHAKGTLMEGQLADLAVLSEDITAIDPAAIKDVSVLATMVGGRLLYSEF